MKSVKALSELSREVLERSERLRFPVVGDSMSPELEPGEAVVVVPLRGRPPRAGEILLFATDEGQPIVHRLVTSRPHRGLLLLATKGDHARSWDPVVPETALIGRVTGVERNGQLLPLPRRRPALLDRFRGWRYLRREAHTRRVSAD